jgi:hypothetical protein
MQRVIILSLVCVGVLLALSKLAAKVESQGSGQLEKPRWSQNNIKRKGEDIKVEVLPRLNE